MNLLGRAFQKMREWVGLADTSESHLTPGHGWLLPVPADARRDRNDTAARRAERAGRA